MIKLGNLLGKRTQMDARERIVAQMGDIAVYAIGDVHGCLKELLELEARIIADSADLQAGKLIIMLGDYVDRGPSSSQVLDHLIAAPPDGFERICLSGNHDIAMFEYLEGHMALEAWLGMGASSTLRSYGVDYERLQAIYRNDSDIDEMVRATIPTSHREFLRSLPIAAMLSRFIFVHAGIRPDRNFSEQADRDLVSIRSEFYEHARLLKSYVVHGHTPIDQPTRYGPRVNIDTGAYFSGRLSALRIWRGSGRFLSTGQRTTPNDQTDQIESIVSR